MSDHEITVKWDSEYGTCGFMRQMESKYSKHDICPQMDIIVLTDESSEGGSSDENGVIQFEPIQNNPLQILFLFIVNALSNQKTFDYHQALVPIILQVRDLRTRISRNRFLRNHFSESQIFWKIIFSVSRFFREIIFSGNCFFDESKFFGR